MKDVSSFLGWLAIVSYVMAVLSYVFKIINKNFKEQITSNKILKKYFFLFMKYIFKYHNLFGFLAILMVLVHFIILVKFELSITGIIAGVLMILQGLTGIYGSYINKKRKGIWISVHRIIAVAIFIMIGFHIL